MFLKTAGLVKNSCRKLGNSCSHVTIVKVINSCRMIHLRKIKENRQDEKSMMAEWIIAQMDHCLLIYGFISLHSELLTLPHKRSCF